MSCIYLKKLNFHIIPPIFLWIVFSFCIRMHIYNFSVMDFVMDLILFPLAIVYISEMSLVKDINFFSK